MQVLPQRTPENETLRRECALLRGELARLLVERTRMLEVVAPELEARYRAALGTLQLALLEAECGVRRLRRKLELLRAALNRGVMPDLEAVDAQLDAELGEWQLLLRTEAAKLEAARTRLTAPLLGATNLRELQSLFRGLAKRCHPDANPAGGHAGHALWLQASAAYAAGDLDALRAFALLADDLPDDLPQTADGSAAGARARREAFKVSISGLLAELDAIGKRFPFSFRARLDDPEWLAEERAGLAVRRDMLADERVLLEAAVTHTLAEAGHG